MGLKRGYYKKSKELGFIKISGTVYMRLPHIIVMDTQWVFDDLLEKVDFVYLENGFAVVKKGEQPKLNDQEDVETSE